MEFGQKQLASVRRNFPNCTWRVQDNCLIGFLEEDKKNGILFELTDRGTVVYTVWIDGQPLALDYTYASHIGNACTRLKTQLQQLRHNKFWEIRLAPDLITQVLEEGKRVFPLLNWFVADNGEIVGETRAGDGIFIDFGGQTFVATIYIADLPFQDFLQYTTYQALFVDIKDWILKNEQNLDWSEFIGENMSSEIDTSTELEQILGYCKIAFPKLEWVNCAPIQHFLQPDYQVDLIGVSPNKIIVVTVEKMGDALYAVGLFIAETVVGKMDTDAANFSKHLAELKADLELGCLA